MVIYQCNKINSTNWCHYHGPNSTLDSGRKQSNKVHEYHTVFVLKMLKILWGKLSINKFSDVSPAHRGVHKICLVGGSWEPTN